MDEIEWWEFDSAKELAEQAAGDIGFVIESAVEAHGNARLALPGEDGVAPVFSALAKAKGFDWSKVSLLPTADALSPPAGAQSLGEIPVRHCGRLRCVGKQHAKKGRERDNRPFR